MSYWFRPKRYGYGATPAGWQGWVFTLGFVALIFAITALMEPGYILASAGGRLLGFGLAAAAILFFVWIAWKKTDGAWRWRWGSSEIEK